MSRFPDHTPVLEGAVRSMLAFVRRTSEPAEVGRSWTTIDYENNPQKNISVFNGSGGISFFLVEAASRYGAPDDLDLAGAATDWCLSFKGKHHRRGLYMGMPGVALAALHRATALGQPIPSPCNDVARDINDHHPGPYTDLIGGAASNGMYLLRLWRKSQDASHLNGAIRCAHWLDQQMTRDGLGTHCLVHPAGTDFPRTVYLGAAHGISGIAHFFVRLAEATAHERWAQLARELLETLIRCAVPSKGGLNWPGAVGRTELARCQWSHGAPGIGLAFLEAARVLHEPRYLEIGLQAAECTYQNGDFRSNYTQCCGLAGGGELLLEAYRTTGDPRWKGRAVEFALSCVAYGDVTPQGEAWPTDAKGLYSVDFLYGASGVGHFLLRVLSDGVIPMPLY